MFAFSRTKYSVNGRYYKREVFDYQNNPLSVYVVRPDFGHTFTSARKAVIFSYDYQNTEPCDVKDGQWSSHSYADVISFGISSKGIPRSNGYDWKHVMDGRYGYTKCMVYYDEDPNVTALYVDMYGYPVAFINNDDVPDERSETTYQFSDFAPMIEFTFSGNVYKCPDERIFHIPSDFYARCSATTAKVTSLVFLLAIIALFI